MKQLFATIIFITFAGTGIRAQTAGDQPTAGTPGKAGKMTISINGGKLSINNTVVSTTWKLSPMVKLVNGTDRRREGYNITHSYDELGIVLFEKTNDKTASGEVTEVQFYIANGDKNDVTPKQLYNGKIELEKTVLKTNTSLETVRKILKDYKESESYTEHSYRFAKNGLYMFIQFDDEDESIQKISVGKDTRTD